MRHQKGRKVRQSHIKKLSSRSDESIVSAVVSCSNRKKNVHSINLALDSKRLIKSIQRSNYQTPNTGTLFPATAENLISIAPQQTAHS